MNIREENILRELNLYPLWVRRDAPVADMHEPAVAVAERPPVTTAGNSGEDDAQHQPPVTEKFVPCEAKTPDTSLVGSLDWVGLKAQVRDCTSCKLRSGCTQTVFGIGDEKAEWLFVGEGPGAEEDAHGEPFVGQAGKLLDNMLAAIKLKRGSNVYIANVVKCHPPENRTPDAEEIATCMPYLRQQIALIKPKLIVALGKTAATSLLGRDATLGSLRGTVHDYHGVPLIVTYHPAYLIRSPSEKAKAWQDLCFAVQRMQQ